MTNQDAHTPGRGIFVAPLDELSDPLLLTELAAEAQQAGWDGFFVCDHVRLTSLGPAPGAAQVREAIRTSRAAGTGRA